MKDTFSLSLNYFSQSEQKTEKQKRVTSAFVLISTSYLNHTALEFIVIHSHTVREDKCSCWLPRFTESNHEHWWQTLRMSPKVWIWKWKHACYVFLIIIYVFSTITGCQIRVLMILKQEVTFSLQIKLWHHKDTTMMHVLSHLCTTVYISYITSCNISSIVNEDIFIM